MPWAGHSQRGSRGSRSAAYIELRARVLADAGYRCQIELPDICRGIATQLDHIIPLADGGGMLDTDNVRAACAPCNQHLAGKFGSRRSKVATGHWSRVW